MKFRFCRDCDCPDWILAEIFTLSKIFQVAKQLLSQSELDDASVAACVSALRWILSNSSAVNIEPSTLESELQQLGLGDQHGRVVARTYDQWSDRMGSSLEQRTLKASGDVKFTYELKNANTGSELEPVVQLNLEGRLMNQTKGFREFSSNEDDSQKTSIYVSKQQLGALIHDLEGAYKHMKEIQPTFDE